MVLITLLLGAACGGGDEEVSPTTAVPSTTTTVTPATTTTTTGPAATTTVVAPPSTTRPLPPTTTATTVAAGRAATALIETDSIAGIPLGANKSQAITVLGQPTTAGQETDLSGARYDFQRWEFAGLRGLLLNYRTQGATSPLLTDWAATAPGPVTAKGITVGNPASAVEAAYGPLGPFCCGLQRAEAQKGPGRMVVLVEPGGNVTQIIGGDPGFWSRSIAD